jgi:EAL domain-containing protein (putative c-di-GMP-specific phosphodiesterase class I)
MHQLLKIGVRFSIDDFGTGYSSLSYLNRIPAVALKIDRSFVTDVDTNPSTATITRAIINLAGNLQMGVIAEGVETAGQAEALYAQGCTAMQGFYFYQPVTARCIGELLRGNAHKPANGQEPVLHLASATDVVRRAANMRDR